MKRQNLLLVAIIIVVLVIASVGSYYWYSRTTTTSGLPDVIKFGCPVPLSGAFADYGAPLKDAILLAQDYVNQHGGIAGKTLQCLVGDDETTPSVGTALIDKYIDEGAALIATTYFDDLALTGMEVCADRKVVYTIGTSSNQVGERILIDPTRYSTVFQLECNSTQFSIGVVNLLDLLQGEYNVSFGSQKTFAVAGGSFAWGRFLASETTRLLEAEGWTLTSGDIIDVSKVTDFTPYLLKWKNDAPDVVVESFAVASSLATLMKQWVDVRPPSLFVSTYTASIPSVRTELIPQESNTIVLADPKALIGPLASEFKNLYLQRYNRDPSPYDGFAFDNILFDAKAVEKAGTLDQAAIANAMLSLSYSGVEGTYKIDPANHGTLRGPGYIETAYFQIQTGELLFIGPSRIKETDYIPQPWFTTHD